MNVLGVNCSSSTAFMVLAADGVLQGGTVEYFQAPAIADSEEELVSALDEFQRILKEVDAHRVVLLKPEGGPRPKKVHAAFFPRITMETVVRLAAVQMQKDLEVLSRQTVRSRLNLPTKGNLALHVQSCAPEKVGNNWSEERQLAAVAAIAGGQS